MAGFQLPELCVEFDDGRKVVVSPKARDLAALERDLHFDINTVFTMVGLYSLAFVTLRRTDPTSAPETVDALIAVADVVPVEDEEDPEGKGSDPVPSTG